MNGSFEREFAEIQVEMINLIWEYCEQRVQKLYICLIQNGNTYSGNFCFKINNRIYSRKFQDQGNSYNINKCEDNQRSILKHLNNSWKKLQNLYKGYEMEIPSIIKIEYNAETKGVTETLSFDELYTSEDSGINEPFDIWLEEIKAEDEE